MIKDKFQVGDLVVESLGGVHISTRRGIGLVVEIYGNLIKLYWLQLGRMGGAWDDELVKLSPTQEKEKSKA